MYDFGLMDSYLRGVQANVEQTCPVLVVFTDEQEFVTKSLCDDPSREKLVHQSAGHTVEVEFIVMEPDVSVIPLFFLEFKGEYGDNLESLRENTKFALMFMLQSKSRWKKYNLALLTWDTN